MEANNEPKYVVYETCMTLFAFVCICLFKGMWQILVIWAVLLRERDRVCSEMERLSSRFILILLESHTLI